MTLHSGSVVEPAQRSLRICFDRRACPVGAAGEAMAAPSVDDLAGSFERYLRAGNKSPRTIETDLEALRGFGTHLVSTSGRAGPARPGAGRAAASVNSGDPQPA
jgi:hypothetical protein